MIRIGPAGWSYKDWEGPVYPPGFPKGSQLALLARHVDAVEVNTSFYRVPSPTLVEGWLRKVEGNPDFRFTLKAWQGWTHEGREGGPEARLFKEVLGLLAGTGRLGLVLFQFPWSFKDSPASRRRIQALGDLFPDHPRGVEVRHASFDTPEFFAFLESRGLAFANIDQPVIGASLAPTERFTAPPAYVRFHGRNYAKWFARGEAWERYDYLYAQPELEPWVAKVGNLAPKGDVFVILNNHYRGQALQNARDLGRLLRLSKPDFDLPLGRKGVSPL